MTLGSEKILDSLINDISGMEEVQSIGISGSKMPLPKAGEGDIDVFIYCDKIPDPSEREAILNQRGSFLQDGKITVFHGGHWGVGDFVLINGIETWLMYFTVTETLNEVESVLDGKYPDKLDNYYYPIGRLAMLKGINILYDRSEFLDTLKKRLSQYPDKLARQLVNYYLDDLDDTEDLERAVIRKDVLFYHFAMDLQVDQFLQALFALNRTFFPSRKRTLDYIKNFSIKPESCDERLLEVIRLGGFSEGVNKSYELWKGLVEELKKISTMR